MNTNWIAGLNILVLLASALLFLYFYNLSVSPVQLAQRIGPRAWVRCGRYRVVAILFELLAAGCYVVYFLYPLPLPLPTRFAWGWSVSFLIALLIAVPSIWLMVRGMVDAGPEAIAPKKEHAMYGGIYKKLRHPQAVGEVFIWWVLAFGLNSPHLVLISLIWLPIFYGICIAEEKDLVLRFGQDYRDYQQSTGRFWPRRAS
jgi:protein-S-isoprenylcysteine O-methyltransferase Ste14